MGGNKELRSIPGFDGYLADSDGHIWSTRRGRWGTGPKMLQLAESFCKNGYSRVNVNNGKKKCSQLTGKLVALAFHGPCPEGLEVSHQDNDPSNNRPSNLLYETHLDNMRRQVDAGTRIYSIHHTNCPLTKQQVKAIRERRAQGEKLLPLAKEFGVSISTISNIALGKRHVS